MGGLAIFKTTFNWPFSFHALSYDNYDLKWWFSKYLFIGFFLRTTERVTFTAKIISTSSISNMFFTDFHISFHSDSIHRPWSAYLEEIKTWIRAFYSFWLCNCCVTKFIIIHFLCSKEFAIIICRLKVCNLHLLWYFHKRRKC